MAKKKYDVAERFQEVARRATAGVNTAPKTKPEPVDTTAFDTRPGRIKGPDSGKDVVLPLSGITTRPKKKL